MKYKTALNAWDKTEDYNTFTIKNGEVVSVYDLEEVKVYNLENSCSGCGALEYNILAYPDDMKIFDVFRNLKFTNDNIVEAEIYSSEEIKDKSLIEEFLKHKTIPTEFYYIADKNESSSLEELREKLPTSDFAKQYLTAENIKEIYKVLGA